MQDNSPLLNTRLPIAELAHQLAAILQKSDQDNSDTKTLSWWLLAAITQRSKSSLIGEKNFILSSQEQRQLSSWTNRLIGRHEPFQYILGTVPFCDLILTVKPPIFIPRPETEEWCSKLCSMLEPVASKPLRILDLCTGSGALALSLANISPRFDVVGVDINSQALQLCETNKKTYNLANVTFIHSDLYEELAKEKPFDLIVSNPPYVSSKEWSTMPTTITEWEDKRAFVAEKNGLSCYQEIINQAPQYLATTSVLTPHHIPRLVLEIGHLQATSVTTLLKKARFSSIQIFPDMAGKNRCITADIQRML